MFFCELVSLYACAHIICVRSTTLISDNMTSDGSIGCPVTWVSIPNGMWFVIAKRSKVGFNCTTCLPALLSWIRNLSDLCTSGSNALARDLNRIWCILVLVWWFKWLDVLWHCQMWIWCALLDLGIGQGEREDKFVLDAKAEMSARGDRRGEKKVEERRRRWRRQKKMMMMRRRRKMRRATNRRRVCL